MIYSTILYCSKKKMLVRKKEDEVGWFSFQINYRILVIGKAEAVSIIPTTLVD